MNGGTGERPAATVAVRVKPNARKAGVGGRHDGPLGPAIVVAVPAPAVDGKANRATIRSLAIALGVRERDISLRLGATSRDKLLRVSDPPDDLDSRVQALLAG